MMLDSARAADDAVRPQRRAAVHGDGRDGGGGPDRGGGRPGHSHGGRPAGGRRAVARDRRGARGARQGALGYTETLGIPSLRARIARHYAETYRRAGRAPSASSSPPARRPAFILAFLAMFEPGDRVAIANPGYPPYRHILTALGCEPVLIETDAATRFAITGESLRAAHAQQAARRRAGRKPGQSDRHHDDAAGAGRADPRGRGRRHPRHLRRDLSRARLRRAGGDRGAAVGATPSSSTRSRNTSA